MKEKIFKKFVEEVCDLYDIEQETLPLKYQSPVLAEGILCALAQFLGENIKNSRLRVLLSTPKQLRMLFLK